ncbi:hypothetical protein CGRA01v4_07128 [Colletotrichum graminicola]|nr:hypothetical protein CGRA01v4_07128 [Colletotrichum graminicola]
MSLHPEQGGSRWPEHYRHRLLYEPYRLQSRLSLPDHLHLVVPLWRSRLDRPGLHCD